MKLFLVSLVVLILQAIGAPALAKDIAGYAVQQQGTESGNSGNGVTSVKADAYHEAQWRKATKEWSGRVMSRAGSLYEEGPLRDGYEGRVEVKFEIGADGIPRECHVYRSSGSEELDAIACTAVRHSGLAPVLLDEQGDAKPVWAVLPVQFVDGDKLELDEGAP